MRLNSLVERWGLCVFQLHVLTVLFGGATGYLALDNHYQNVNLLKKNLIHIAMHTCKVSPSLTDVLSVLVAKTGTLPLLQYTTKFPSFCITAVALPFVDVIEAPLSTNEMAPLGTTHLSLEHSATEAGPNTWTSAKVR